MKAIGMLATPKMKSAHWALVAVCGFAAFALYTAPTDQLRAAVIQQSSDTVKVEVTWTPAPGNPSAYQVLVNDTVVAQMPSSVLADTLAFAKERTSRSVMICVRGRFEGPTGPESCAPFDIASSIGAPGTPQLRIIAGSALGIVFDSVSIWKLAISVAGDSIYYPEGDSLYVPLGQTRRYRGIGWLSNVPFTCVTLQSGRRGWAGVNEDGRPVLPFAFIEDACTWTWIPANANIDIVVT